MLFLHWLYLCLATYCVLELHPLVEKYAFLKSDEKQTCVKYGVN